MKLVSRFSIKYTKLPAKQGLNPSLYGNDMDPGRREKNKLKDINYEMEDNNTSHNTENNTSGDKTMSEKSDTCYSNLENDFLFEE